MTTSTNLHTNPTVLVTGANGFIGLWLVPELINQGYRVVAAMRQSERRAPWFRAEIARRITRTDDWQDQLKMVEFSLGNTAELAAQIEADHSPVHAIYHLAGAFSWGMDAHQAHEMNVAATVQLLEWVAGLRQLERFVWVGGYRISQDMNQPEEQLYRELGAYEASKFIAHRKIIDTANRFNIPWTALNPATVIGDSQTGETAQFIGVAELVEQLYNKQLTVIPGNTETFVPLVHVDFVAEFAVTVLRFPQSVGEQYWLLDPDTPPLHSLIKTFADQLGVAAPRYFVPLKLLEKLPGFLLPGSKETLSYLAEDRYPTESAEALTQAMRLKAPLTIQSINRWVDSLVDQQFGKATELHHGSRETGFQQGLWQQKIKSASKNKPVVLLHGLPLNGDSWSPLLNEQKSGCLESPVAIPDLPGMGRSGLSPAINRQNRRLNTDWIDSVVQEKSVLVGHSLGAGYALQFAHDFPERVDRVVLISPYFLQEKPPAFFRFPWLAGLLSSFMSMEKLALQLHPDGLNEPAVASAINGLKRPGGRRHLLAYLALVANESHRKSMRMLLANAPVPVTLIAGEKDPLIHETDLDVHLIRDAGHNLQLTHPKEVAGILSDLHWHEPEKAASDTGRLAPA